MKTTVYEVVYGSNISEFTDKVNEYLADDWELYGSPFCDSDGCLHQAIVTTVLDDDDEDDTPTVQTKGITATGVD